MEEFQAWDRHNPLPHITLSPTALKSPYENTTFLSTRTSAELQELLIQVAGNGGPPGGSSSSADVAAFLEVCFPR
jgi:hypothetical protein